MTSLEISNTKGEPAELAYVQPEMFEAVIPEYLDWMMSNQEFWMDDKKLYAQEQPTPSGRVVSSPNMLLSEPSNTLSAQKKSNVPGYIVDEYTNSITFLCKYYDESPPSFEVESPTGKKIPTTSNKYVLNEVDKFIVVHVDKLDRIFSTGTWTTYVNGEKYYNLDDEREQTEPYVYIGRNIDHELTTFVSDELFDNTPVLNATLLVPTSVDLEVDLVETIVFSKESSFEPLLHIVTTMGGMVIMNQAMVFIPHLFQERLQMVKYLS